MTSARMRCNTRIFAATLVVTTGVLANVCTSRTADEPVPGFSAATNARLDAFFRETQTERGRKIAVFDGDGTTFGQAPHYLADECLYEHAAANPGRRPEVLRRMRGVSNVSLPYVQDRVLYFSGENPDFLRKLGEDCFHRNYADKIYPPMRALVERLKANSFEVWIVTASPEALYQGFLSREYALPIERVIGVKSIVHHGKMTDRIVQPVPQDEGKMEAIETFIGVRPLFAAGNSRGDREMIESSRGLHLIINPDEHIPDGETESVADYAKRAGWLIERISDVAPENFPRVSSRQFGVRENRAHP